MTGAEISVAIAGMRALAGTVSRWAKGKASKEELLQLTVRYWGCILYELDSNLRSLILANAHRQPGSIVPQLRFTFADALLADLARLSPLPNALSVVANMIRDHRLVADYVRLDTDTLARGSGTGRALDVSGTWRDYMWDVLPVHIERYNILRGAVADEGRKVFGDEWQTIESVIIPDPLPEVK